MCVCVCVCVFTGISPMDLNVRPPPLFSDQERFAMANRLPNLLRSGL
jgi:hypothetical protein